MIAHLYIEVNIVCILILASMIVKIGTSTYAYKHQVVFSLELGLFILMFISDSVRNLIDKKIINASIIFHNAANISYFSISIVITLIWLMYTLLRIEHPLFSSKTAHGIICIPALIMIVISVNSVSNHWLFYVDEANHMHKGFLWPVYVLVAFLYGIVASIFTIKPILNKSNIATKPLYISLAIFPFFPIVAIALQGIYEGYPITCVGVSFPLLVYFYKILESESLADRDSLLFNKNWLYLTHKNLLKAGRMDNLYLMMITAYGGKGENIRYLDSNEILNISRFLGHLNGTVMDIKSIDAVRYSSSAFILIVESESIDAVDTLSRYIKKEASSIAPSKNKTSFNISTGYKAYTRDALYVQDLIHEIDEAICSNQ